MAKAVQAIGMALAFGMGAARAQDAPATLPDLRGKEAPAFELPSLKGDKVSLRAMRGKDIVVLHFAASW